MSIIYSLRWPSQVLDSMGIPRKGMSQDERAARRHLLEASRRFDGGRETTIDAQELAVRGDGE